MPLKISDFIADTIEMDATETGAYLMLLMAQWKWGGQSLPDDMAKLQRIARCTRNWPRVWEAISVHFERDADGWFNPKGREVFTNVRAKSTANSNNGSLGGKANALKNHVKVVANATVSLKQPEPEPEVREDRVLTHSRPSDDFQASIDHFNATADRVGWPKVQRFTATRKAALAHRISDIGGEEAWRDAIDRAARSPLLTGQTGRGWRADFDWLCKAANFTKLCEGNYDPRPDQPGHRAAPERGPGGAHDSMVRAFASVAGAKGPH
jgi:uncharacterized protein YdaU (DUF1376 family)